MNSNIIIKRDTSTLLISSIIIVAGLMFMILPGNMLGKESVVKQILFFTGLILFIWGFIMLIFYSKHKVLAESGVRIKSHSFYFKQEEYNQLINYLSKSEFDKVAMLEGAVNTGIRLDTSLSVDGKFACYQLFRYIPYNFVKDTGVMVVADESLSEFYSLNDKLLKMKR